MIQRTPQHEAEQACDKRLDPRVKDRTRSIAKCAAETLARDHISQTVEFHEAKSEGQQK